jgi:hypothetical protein
MMRISGENIARSVSDLAPNEARFRQTSPAPDFRFNAGGEEDALLCFGCFHSRIGHDALPGTFFSSLEDRSGRSGDSFA